MSPDGWPPDPSELTDLTGTPADTSGPDQAHHPIEPGEPIDSPGSGPPQPAPDEKPPEPVEDEPDSVSRKRFEELVSEALDDIPPALAEAMDNVVVFVEEENPEEPDLLGVYEGVALTERTHDYAGVLPDRITVYRRPILRASEDEDEVVHEVLVTVVHEIAHHFGLDEQTLRRLGWG